MNKNLTLTINEPVWIKKVKVKGVVKYIEPDGSIICTYFDKKGVRHIRPFHINQLDNFSPKKQVEVDNNTILFAKVRDTATIPSKREEDGCYDVYADFEEDELRIKRGEVVLVPTGIASAFSSKYRINCARERGSTGKIGLQVLSGQIDSGYRGEWFVALHNSTDKDIVISKSYKDTTTVVGHEVATGHCHQIVYYPYTKAICQCAVEIVPQVRLKEIKIDDLEKIPSERGKTKLGQSGK